MRIWIAGVAAVLIQPFVLALRMAPDFIGSSQPIYGLGIFLVAVIAVSAAMIFLFGIPTFLVLRKLRRDGWASLCTAGFVLGVLPVLFSWPTNIEGYSSGQNWHGRYVELYVNGIPTKYAWFTYAENAAFFGLHGLVGALVFYTVLRHWHREP